MEDAGTVLNWALGIAVAVFLAGLGTVVWLFRDKLTDFKSLLTLVAFLAILPMAAQLVRQKTNLFSKANTEITISAVEVVKTGDNKAVVYLTLSDSAFAIMEYKDLATGKARIVPPLGRTQQRVGHAFEIETGKKGGLATFTINGRRQDKPVEVK